MLVDSRFRLIQIFFTFFQLKFKATDKIRTDLEIITLNSRILQ